MKNNNKDRLFEMMEKINGSDEKPEFIIPVGISGSGKSRWIKTLDNSYTIISPDEIRRELTGDVSDQTKNALVFDTAFKRTIDALNAANNVVFDATNINSFHRKKMLDTLREKVSVDFKAYAKIFDADPEVTKERIRLDIENGVDRSNVPSHAIDRQYKTFKSDLNKIESDGYLLM